MQGKTHEGKPFVRLDEGEVASAAKPRRGTLLCKYAGPILAVAMLLIVTQTALAAVAISNLRIQQRYPWNGKVDISFNLASTRTDIGLKFEAFDTNKGEPVPIVTIYKEDGSRMEYPYQLPTGNHHLVWDAPSDVVAGYKTDTLAVSITAGPVPTYHKYCVIDLSGGPAAMSYPISYLDDVPAGGWTDDYRTNKLLFRYCPPGTFRQGPNGSFMTTALADSNSRMVTLTKPFYIGVFPISRKQWRLVMGEDLGQTSGGDADRLTGTLYDIVRGANKAYQFPSSFEVDEGSFIGKLRARTIPLVDLPTEAQWEYACKAGLRTDDAGYLVDMDGNRYASRNGSGIFDPNAWGLYGIPGGWELCVDWLNPLYGTKHVVDPMGCTFEQSRPVQYGVGYNALRGSDEGEWMWDRIFNNTALTDPKTSFRLAIWLDRD